MHKAEKQTCAGFSIVCCYLISIAAGLPTLSCSLESLSLPRVSSYLLHVYRGTTFSVSLNVYRVNQCHRVERHYVPFLKMMMRMPRNKPLNLDTRATPLLW